MSLPATIHTSVGQSLIGKVSRLFNNSVTDVLNELLQNARRADASRIEIDVVDDDGRSILVVRDDGSGVADPAKLVTLGDSGWNEATQHREDPAGMGVFSLAGRPVEIRSRARGTDNGWRVVIAPKAWETGAPLAVEPWAADAGTELRIGMPEAWGKDLAAAAANAARHYPLPVLFKGEELKRADFLAGAVRVEDWEGCRIGVFLERGHIPSNYPRINFHGLTVCCPLPSINEVETSECWHVRIDIVDAPALQLVLPARKEMVQNAALDHLREAAERAIFRAIAHHGRHRLAHAQWLRARALGIDLPEAECWLPAWFPRTADGNSMPVGERVVDRPMMLFPDAEPPIEQCAARVLRSGEILGGALVREVSAFAGYRWYDLLPRISALSFRIEAEGEIHRYEEGLALPDTMQSGTVAAIMLDVSISPSGTPGESVSSRSFPAAVLIAPDDGWSADLDETLILLAPGCSVDPNELADLLEASCFCASDDVDNDSWQTQQRYFLVQARQIANTLLRGEDAAILERIRDIVHEEIRWLIPAGRRVSMVAGDSQIDLAFVDKAASLSD